MKRLVPIALPALLLVILTALFAFTSRDVAGSTLENSPIDTPFTAEMSSAALARNGQQVTTGEALSCGVAPLSDAEIEAAEDELKRRLALTTVDQGTLNIPVAFHVIMNDAGTQGQVTDQQIADQIDVLNDAFAGEGFQFFLLQTTRSHNTTWFNDGGGYYNALAITPATVMNIYSNSAGGNLGYVPFLPNTSPGSVGTNADRVVVLWSSLPGGSTIPYNEGDTATHEVGHYLGLYHTFQGGCSEPNDLVADTPAIGGPNFGCPSPGHNTCALPGNDDYTNFMDYVDDPCMDHFTAGQFTRMRDITATFRPDLGNLNWDSLYLPIVARP